MWHGTTSNQHNDYQNRWEDGGKLSTYLLVTTKKTAMPTHTNWGSGGTKLQQSGTPNRWIRTGPNRTRMVLLDNIPRKKQSHTMNSHWILALKHRDGHLLVLQQHWQYQDQTQPDNTEHPHLLDWLKTIVTGLDYTGRSNHPQYRHQWGYPKPRNHVQYEQRNTDNTWTRGTSDPKPQMKPNWWNFHHPGDPKQLMRIP